MPFIGTDLYESFTGRHTRQKNVFWSRNLTCFYLRFIANTVIRLSLPRTLFLPIMVVYFTIVCACNDFIKRLVYVAFIRFSLHCTCWPAALFCYLFDLLKTKINLSYVERICSYRAVNTPYFFSFSFYFFYLPIRCKLSKDIQHPCVAVSISIMKEIPPMKHLLFRFNLQGSIFDTGDCT